MNMVGGGKGGVRFRKELKNQNVFLRRNENFFFFFNKGYTHINFLKC